MSTRSVVTAAHILLAAWLLAIAGGCALPTEPAGGQRSPLASPVTKGPSPTPLPETIHTSLPPTPTGSAAVPSLSAEPSPLPSAGSPPVGTGRQGLIRRAMEDLAERLGVEPEEVVLVSVFADEFPASNLGCPSPEEPPVAIPAFVTGLEIVLAVHDQQYVYHARGGMVIFCGVRG